MSNDPNDREIDQAGPAPAAATDSSVGLSSSDLEIEVEAPAEPSPVERIAELEAKIKETHDRLLRSLADHENFKKRTKKELDDARTDAAGRVLREMLPVVDNLERALLHAEQGDGGGVVEGVRLVQRQFGQALERLGVTAIDAKGKPFDPNLHEAVSQVESAELPAGSVVDVLQTGYKIGERLLRPTLAVVSKAPSAPGPAAGEGGGAGE